MNKQPADEKLPFPTKCAQCNGSACEEDIILDERTDEETQPNAEKAAILQALHEEMDEFLVAVKSRERRFGRKLSIAEELKLMNELDEQHQTEMSESEPDF